MTFQLAPKGVQTAAKVKRKLKQRAQGGSAKTTAQALVAIRRKAADATRTAKLAAIAESQSDEDGEDSDGTQQLQQRSCGLKNTTRLLQYLYKIDSRQVKKHKAMKYNLFHALMTNDCALTVKGVEKKIKGLDTFIKEVKRDVHASASLRPRMSDPDFEDGKLDDDADESWGLRGSLPHRLRTPPHPCLHTCGTWWLERSSHL